MFSGRFGTDRVTDFTDGDVIDLRGLGISFDEAMAATRQDGSDVRLEFANGTIVLENVELVDLDSSDFLF